MSVKFDGTSVSGDAIGADYSCHLYGGDITAGIGDPGYNGSQDGVGYDPTDEGTTGWGRTGSLLLWDQGRLSEDPAGMASSDGNIIIKRSGLYIISATCRWEAVSDTQLLIRVETRDNPDGDPEHIVTMGQASSFIPGTSVLTPVNLTFLARLSAGTPPYDTLWVRACTDAGGEQTVSDIQVFVRWIAGA